MSTADTLTCAEHLFPSVRTQLLLPDDQLNELDHWAGLACPATTRQLAFLSLQQKHVSWVR